MVCGPGEERERLCCRRGPKEACIHTLTITSVVDACGCCKSMLVKVRGEITLVCGWVCVGMISCLLKQNKKKKKMKKKPLLVDFLCHAPSLLIECFACAI